MLLTRRSPTIDATHYIYTSSRLPLAEHFGGVVDTVTGDLYIQTSDGIRIVPYGHWIVTEGDRVSILTETQIFTEFEPVNAQEAYNMLGSRWWPGTDPLLKAV